MDRHAARHAALVLACSRRGDGANTRAIRKKYAELFQVTNTGPKRYKYTFEHGDVAFVCYGLTPARKEFLRRFPEIRKFPLPDEENNDEDESVADSDSYVASESDDDDDAATRQRPAKALRVPNRADVARNCVWVVGERKYIPALSSAFADNVNVHVVASRSRDAGWLSCTSRVHFTVDALISKHGMTWQTQNSVYCTPLPWAPGKYQVLAVYASLGCKGSDDLRRKLKAAVDSVQGFAKAMKEHFNECKIRRQIYMCGPRKLELQRNDEFDDVGYYKPKKNHANLVMTEVADKVTDFALNATALERLLSPEMAKYRKDFAGPKHPGVIPGKEHVFRGAVGASIGLANRLHVERGIHKPVECIVFDGRQYLPPGPQRKHRYGFCVAEAGAVFDLSRGAIVMTPGDVVHGTPKIGDGSRKVHFGMGAVLVNKLKSNDTRWLYTKLKTNPVEDTNPFTKAWDMNQAQFDEVPCPICQRQIQIADTRNIICAGCSMPFHMDCVGLRTVPKGTWRCPDYPDCA